MYSGVGRGIVKSAVADSYKAISHSNDRGPTAPPAYPYHHHVPHITRFQKPLIHAATVAQQQAQSQQPQQTSAPLKDNLKIAWGSYIDKGVSIVTSEMLAHFLFGATPKPHDYYTAHCLLMEDDLYFERTCAFNMESSLMKGRLINYPQYSFKCRSFKEVTETEKKRKDNAYYKLYLPIFLQRVQKKLADDLRLKETAVTTPVGQKKLAVEDLPRPPKNTPKPLAEGEDLSWNPNRDRIFISKLKEYALAKDSEEELDDIALQTYQDLIQPLGIGPKPFEVYQFLVTLGIFDKNHNPNLLRYPKPLEFSPAEIKKYDELNERFISRKVPPWIYDQDLKSRRDLTHILPTFAIDDEKTAEIDDCITLENRADGTTWIYIHIADPSRMVRPNDSLDLLARDRVRSVYIPEKEYPMFPPAISLNHFSLLPSKTNCALTYIVQLDPNSGKVESYEITPSIIDHVKILSYTQVDTVLGNNNKGTSQSDISQDNQEILKQLNQLAIKRRLWRENNGAVFISLPHSKITINNDRERVEVVSVSPQSESRTMIAEYMILAGEITAHFAQKHQIPIPYRSQKFRTELPKGMTDVSSNLIKNIMYNWDLRSKLCSAQFSEIPKPHQSLALLAYCQVTSPIRRYLDLLVHYQIKAHLRGESLPFKQQTIKQIFLQQELPLFQLSELTTQSQRYWILRYLEQLKPTGSLLKALTLQIQYSLGPYGALVLLLDLGYETSVTLKRNPVIGEIIYLSVLSVDPYHNSLMMEEFIS